MARLRRAWQIFGASSRVLAARRALVGVAAVTYLAACVVGAALFAVGAALAPEGVAPEDGRIFAWVTYAFAALGATWVTFIGQGAIIAGAAQHMDGREPTVGTALSAARERLGQLFVWAVLVTGVHLLLRAVRSRTGSGATSGSEAAASAGGLAFNTVTFLALPVVMFDGAGPIEALKRSTALLKRTWGENLSFNFAMSLLETLAMLPGLAIAWALIAAGTGPLPLVGLATGIGWFLLVLAVGSALSAVFKAALYRWAHDLPVDPAFDRVDIERAFSPSQR